MKIERLFDVRGLATVVTGGASGIGLALAEAMAENGARVTIMDINAAAIEAEVSRLRTMGGDVRGELVDITDRPATKRAFDTAAAHYGRLDVVFANAGIDSGPGFLNMQWERASEGAVENLSDEIWDKVIATNLTSVFTTIRAAVPHMKPHRSGRIIVTTSVAALRGEPIVGTPYMPAKAGAAHLVHQVAQELAKYNIQVNAIAPGAFITNIGGGHMKKPEVLSMFSRHCPTGRAATTDEIQGVALFLASPASRYVTGVQIAVDGGMLLGPAD
ncbi:MAG: SDR family NAD(P)-dependent oxidoreductase [Rhodospirillales bacterium]|nr:SDR family NAD(P)-dependent oxidoreductase [Rhodospirillales bacterium]